MSEEQVADAVVVVVVYLVKILLSMSIFICTELSHCMQAKQLYYIWLCRSIEALSIRFKVNLWDYLVVCLCRVLVSSV